MTYSSPISILLSPPFPKKKELVTEARVPKLDVVEGGEEAVAERGVVVLGGLAAVALSPKELEVDSGIVRETEGCGKEDIEDDGELDVKVAEEGGEVGPPEQQPGATDRGDIGDEQLGAEAVNSRAVVPEQGERGWRQA